MFEIHTTLKFPFEFKRLLYNSDNPDQHKLVFELENNKIYEFIVSQNEYRQDAIFRLYNFFIKAYKKSVETKACAYEKITTYLEYPFEIKEILYCNKENNEHLLFVLPNKIKLRYDIEEFESYEETLYRIYEELMDPDKSEERKKIQEKNIIEKRKEREMANIIVERFKNVDILPSIFGRTSIFLAVDRLKQNNHLLKEFTKNKNVLIFKNPYYKIEIRNRLLTMQHLRILLALMATSNSYKVTNSNEIQIEFSLYSAAKKAGLFTNRKNYGSTTRNYALQLLKEMTDITIVVMTNDTKQGIIFKLIERITFDDDSYILILSKDFTKILSKELLFNIKNIDLRQNALILKLILFIHTQTKKRPFRIKYNTFLQHNGIEPKKNRKILFELRQMLQNENILKTLEKHNIFINNENELIEYYPHEKNIESIDKNLILTT